MSNYGRCKDCEWGEPESGTWKWYCSYYKTYEDPDEVQDCKQFKERGSSSGGCFLTTACCDYKGLPDDCYELETMRRFRDEYLLKQKDGEAIVNLYYDRAPVIVERIEKMDKKEAILEYIYTQVQECVRLFEEKEYDNIEAKYLMMMYKVDLYTMGELPF